VKKVVILTRAFPPSNKTAAFRVYYWTKHLHKFGYYPIIVTRNWDRILSKEEEIRLPTGDKVEHKKFENFEVFYLPFPGSVLDRFNNKFNCHDSFLSKMVGVFQFIFGECLLISPNKIPYLFLVDYLKKNPDINKMIISGPPFTYFYIGYKLKRKFPLLSWIADYRDEWNTSGLISNVQYSKKWQKFLSAFKESGLKKEKRWLSNSSAFIAVSNNGKKNISELINSETGTLIPNGFDDEDFKNLKTEKVLFSEFTITYSGWLYESQEIEIFFDGVKLFLNRLIDEQPRFKIIFIGGNYFPGMQERIRKNMFGFERFYELTNFLSKVESIEIQMRSHLLLMSAHKGQADIPSSKLYEYIGTEKLVLCCPPDNGIVTETLESTGQGIFCQTAKDTCDRLFKLYKDYKNDKPLIPQMNRESKNKYSRNHGLKILADLLNSI
jgi:hypothetical protein